MKVRAALLLATLALPASAGEPQGVEFRVTSLAVRGRRMATLAYDFNGDGKSDLLHASIDFDKTPAERWLAVHYQRDGNYAADPDQVWGLDDRAGALLFGDYLPGGGVEVGFLGEDGAYVYPWAGGKIAAAPLKILHVATFFRAPSLRALPVWQWRMDYTADRLDDLIVPLRDGYRLYFQTEPGVFGKTATLEADLPAGAARVLAGTARAEKPEIAPVHFQVAQELPRLEPVDINGDGLTDFVMIRRDAATYFLQKEKGVFPSNRPFRVSYSVPTLGEEPRKDSVNLNLIRFVDINADKLADLVVTKIEGQLGLWESIRTSIYLHLGNGKGNFIADKRIVIDGVSIDPEFIDMDLDGRLDAVTSRLRTDLMKQAVNAVILGDVAISYEIFQFDAERNSFLADPVYEKQIFVPKGDLEKTGKGAVPLVFIRGDLSGDGRPDLIMVDPKTSDLLVHPGRVQETSKGARIGFDGTAHWTIPLGKHPGGIHLIDLNSDGLNDVMVEYSSSIGLVLSQKR